MAGVGRFRVNAFYQRGSVAMAVRRVRTSASSIDEFGLPDVVRRLAEEKRGLVLVTGPTGSGKTTTLAAMINHINETRACHIITVEDPIEYLHTDATPPSTSVRSASTPSPSRAPCESSFVKTPM